MKKNSGKLALAIAIIVLLIPTIALSGCKEDASAMTPPVNKASSQLILQISLRKEQIESPTSQRLAQMKSMGMQAQDLAIQRIYIYLYQPLTGAQTGDLKALGLILYPDSWMPPASNNRTGFMLADMPVDKLNDLAAKNFIVSLDTAEKPSQPQTDMRIGG
jgi:hypothetical protein